MAVWELGKGWTFDTDKFLDALVDPVLDIATIATLPVSAPVAIVRGGVRILAPVAARAIPAAKALIPKIIVPITKRVLVPVAKRVLIPVTRWGIRKIYRWAPVAYKWYRRYKILEGILALFNDLTLDDHVVVTVRGNPNSNRQQLYYLACAAAFSKVKRYNLLSILTNDQLSIPPGLFCIEYDQASKTVEVTLKYVTSLNLAAGAAARNSLRELVLLTGPPSTLTGGTFNFGSAFTTIGGIVGVPQLPYDGKLILTDNILETDPVIIAKTGNISTNPKPPGDLRSRGSLYSLVYTALTTPTGSILKTFNPPIAGSVSAVAGKVTGG